VLPVHKTIVVNDVRSSSAGLVSLSTSKNSLALVAVGRSSEKVTVNVSPGETVEGETVTGVGRVSGAGHRDDQEGGQDRQD
jgi:hypothetical protein